MCSKSEVAYPPSSLGNNIIGFNGVMIPHYLYSLCAWMAVKKEVKDEDGKYCIFYDDEKILININEETNNDLNVNENGILMKRKISVLENPMAALSQHLNGIDYKKEAEILNKINDNWVMYSNKNNFAKKPKVR